MNSVKKQQMSESFLIGGILAFTGGFLDVYTYICRGNVFANAETGNIVLLGIKLIEGNLDGVLHYLVPIVSFSLGVLFTEMVQHKYKQSRKIHWRRITISLEIIVLFAISFVPANEVNNLITNSLVSFVCSIQVQSFRQINGSSIATTMCTGNLRSGTESLYRYLLTKDRKKLISTLNYFGIILIFILGAALSCIITKKFMIKAVLFPCVFLFIVLLLMSLPNNDKKMIKLK